MSINEDNESQPLIGNIKKNDNLPWRDITALVQSLSWALVAGQLTLIFTCADISDVQTCELKKALDSIFLEYTPYPCKNNAIKEISLNVLIWGIMQLAIELYLIVISTFLPSWESKSCLKILLPAIYMAASIVFMIAYKVLSDKIVDSVVVNRDIDYVHLQSAMLSELQDHYSSENINSGDKYSNGWNNFFIQYDCCAIREVQGKTNDFESTPWCKSSGSCNSTFSKIPKTCCKDVTTADYQNAPSICYVSMDSGTYKQSCISRMRALNTINIDDSKISSLILLLNMLSVFKMIELGWAGIMLFRYFRLTCTRN